MQLKDSVGYVAITARKAYWKKQLTLYYRYRYVYLLIFPTLIFFLIFKIVPLWGLLLAFKDYDPYVGFLGSKWIGFKNFLDFFSSQYFYMMLRNTVAISMINLVFFFPAPIMLAILLNEIHREKYKRFIQTIIYMPHFLSWVVITGMTFFALSTDIGFMNKIIIGNGGKTIAFLSDPKLFWWLLLGQNIWKELGWNTIIFLAAITQIDPSLYEAAIMDGATRMRQIRHITIPSILPIIIVLFIIRLGHIMDVGFEQVLLMINPYVRDVGEIFDTYAYTQGITQSNYSVAITVGIFKGVVGLCMVVVANKIIKSWGQEGIY